MSDSPKSTLATGWSRKIRRGPPDYPQPLRPRAVQSGQITWQRAMACGGRSARFRWDNGHQLEGGSGAGTTCTSGVSPACPVGQVAAVAARQPRQGQAKGEQ